MISKDKNTRQLMTGEKALDLLKAGNQRYQNKQFLNRDFEVERQATSTGQYPFAVVLSCIDSRVPTEIIFDQGIGDIFNVKIAGNVVNEDVLGSLEFACKLAGSKLLLVLGHTSCGAVMGACDHVKMGNLTGLLKKIELTVIEVEKLPGMLRDSSNKEFVNEVARRNVLQTMKNIITESAVLYKMLENNDITMVGAMYDIETGKVNFDIPS
jgi:carbonic anhydrase